MNEARMEAFDCAREEYSAPTYERLVFETSDLTMSSAGQIGAYWLDESDVADDESVW